MCRRLRDGRRSWRRSLAKDRRSRRRHRPHPPMTFLLGAAQHTTPHARGASGHESVCRPSGSGSQRHSCRYQSSYRRARGVHLASSNTRSLFLCVQTQVILLVYSSSATVNGPRPSACHALQLRSPWRCATAIRTWQKFQLRRPALHHGSQRRFYAANGTIFGVFGP